ncbi:DUF3299 domain-containing protein [Roseibium sp. MMSF_3412]|uniref:DUF3299 domain-containing protein n=1 Tax=Roseibium sp. MMSF_3412 TaxID=3046712 RepID=UPI00273E76E9|nr:DUF3299 domain-containing protein [Roseibium sp. MMSF_3412]
MRAVLCLIMLIGLMQPAWAVKQVNWQDLIDPVAADFDDPFAALGLAELRSLGTVLRLRKMLADPGLSSDARPEIAARLDREEAKLAVSGVDTDGLLSRRQEIGRKRAEAVMSGNPDLDGRSISIPGYVIPVPDTQTTTSNGGYLVPERGMCSHMPAPDPNQMIRYTLETDWTADSLYEPVELVGTLSIRPSRQEITLIDGQVEMIAVFDMQVTAVVPRAETEPDTKQRSFLHFLRPKAR